MTSVVAAKSGTQWSIEADGQSAVVVEVGGTLRGYSAGDVAVLDGFEVDELSPASAGQILAPWPNRVRDGQYTFEEQKYQLSLTEPARRSPRRGPPAPTVMNTPCRRPRKRSGAYVCRIDCR